MQNVEDPSETAVSRDAQNEAALKDHGSPEPRNLDDESFQRQHPLHNEGSGDASSDNGREKDSENLKEKTSEEIKEAEEGSTVHVNGVPLEGACVNGEVSMSLQVYVAAMYSVPTLPLVSSNLDVMKACLQVEGCGFRL